MAYEGKPSDKYRNAGPEEMKGWKLQDWAWWLKYRYDGLRFGTIYTPFESYMVGGSHPGSGLDPDMPMFFQESGEERDIEELFRPISIMRGRVNRELGGIECYGNLFVPEKGSELPIPDESIGISCKVYPVDNTGHTTKRLRPVITGYKIRDEVVERIEKSIKRASLRDDL